MQFKNSYKEKIKEYVKEKNLTYTINTMGCQMNENDSAKYIGILESMGFKKTDEKEANLILFNTCCVRENAENTLFGRLGKLKQRKNHEKYMYIVVVGCMTQQKQILDKIKKSYPFTDIVLGTNRMDIFPERLYESIILRKKSFVFSKESEEIIEDIPIIYQDKHKASVSIIYGCNNFCSYCIVPYVRGRERSRKKEDILNDIKIIAKKGYKEVMLLGQNVNSYGNDLEEGVNFSKLLEEIEKIEGIEIIRFISPHPKDFKEDLVEVIKKSSKIARQIHLPLQSGSTKILDKMNRKYTKEDYLSIANKLKSADENVSLSTDIIIGFPGETEEDFNETLDVVKKVGFDQIYMYIYSKRTGTKADLMEDITSEKEKVKRLELLKKVYEEILPSLNFKFLGGKYKVLVEGRSKNNPEMFTGRTSQNKVVVFEAKESDIGNIVNVKIDEDHLWYLKGSIVKI